MKSTLSLIALALLFTHAATATTGHDHSVTMPKEFDKLKGLVGTWEGTSKDPSGKDVAVSVVYELTSGGTAIVEKLMPGTPHEMVTVYHKDGKSLALTHYCSLGNQPHMKLKKAEDKKMVWEMTKPVGVTSMKEPHMHALTLTWTDADKIQQEWVHYEGGKKKNVAQFTLARKKT